MGRDDEYPLTIEQEDNAFETLSRVNQLLIFFGEWRRITSGYRPGKYNEAYSPTSKHVNCQACDLADPVGDLDDFCYKNQEILANLGLYLEHPDATPGWTHLQTVPPKSGKRVFRPQ